MINGRKIVAIIPARGGSRGIPRKNSRLLAGKPLLSYSISNCLKSKYIDHVFVSTECHNLQDIAVKFGANVVDRKLQFAEDNVALDEVIVDAIGQIENKMDCRFDFVVSIQATSPLVSPKSIDDAIKKCINKEFDTIVSAVNDSHLQWGHDNQGDIIPLYKQRLNRQYLPKIYKETGGFVISKRAILDKKTRFGQYVFLFQINKEEAVDIDDRYDWWLAEKSLLRKKLCFHVIGNRKKGLGHVYRALSLADRIMDHDILFVVNEENQLAIQKITSQFYKLKVCAKGEELDTIIDSSPHIVINDILNTDITYMKKLKAHRIATINFEDLGRGSTLADTVINALFDDHPHLKKEQMYSGIDYCCLRDEFFYTKPKEYSEEVKNILIVFGGTDPENVAHRTLRWLEEIKGNWKINVILGLGYPKEKENEIIQFARHSPKEIQIIKDTTLISKYMQEADIAITAAGRTVFELTSLGVPMIVIASNAHELSHSILHNSFGLISLGVWKNVNKNVFQNTVLDLVNSKLLRAKMRHALLSQNVHNGIENVLSIIQDVIKKSNTKF